MIIYGQPSVAGLSEATTSDNKFYALRRDRLRLGRVLGSPRHKIADDAHTGRCVFARHREPLRPHFLPLIGFTD